MIGIKMSMPDECHKCPFYLGGFVCSLTLDITPIEDRPEWCPLIDLEQEEKE
ncbi:MAG: hypothetical protein IKG55_07955 [Solobacterium sp.]|nr:hypothetical protein [Solobacterium sp.]